MHVPSILLATVALMGPALVAADNTGFDTYCDPNQIEGDGDCAKMNLGTYCCGSGPKTDVYSALKHVMKLSWNKDRTSTECNGHTGQIWCA
ncbi:hypothetical protein E4U42_004292 [Claviceps africana]|uniref:Uncharacterized protein n=1 Tax=Claviceps africana TaxID=83212 RepID=A0A8K0J5I2_9HYPO|nr:hypothetical protein E4U42_004292 [Claviceps africana]